MAERRLLMVLLHVWMVMTGEALFFDKVLQKRAQACSSCLPKGWRDCQAACTLSKLGSACAGRKEGCCSCVETEKKASPKADKLQQFRQSLLEAGWTKPPQIAPITYQGEDIAVFNPSGLLLADNRTVLILSRAEVGRRKDRSLQVLHNVRNFQSQTRIIAALAHRDPSTHRIQIHNETVTMLFTRQFRGTAEDPILYLATNRKPYALISVYRKKRGGGNHQMFGLHIQVNLKNRKIRADWLNAVQLCSNIVPSKSEEKNWSPFQLNSHDYLVYQVNPLVILAVDFVSGRCQHRSTHDSTPLAGYVRRCKRLTPLDEPMAWNRCIGRPLFESRDPSNGRTIPWPASLSVHLSGSTAGVQISPLEVLLVGHTKVKLNSLLVLLKSRQEAYVDIGPMEEWHQNYEQEYFMFFYVVKKASLHSDEFTVSKISNLYLQPPNRNYDSTKIVFPRGLWEDGSRFFVTYGEADLLSEAMSISRQDLLDMLMPIRNFEHWANTWATSAELGHRWARLTSQGAGAGTAGAGAAGAIIPLPRVQNSLTAPLRSVLPLSLWRKMQSSGEWSRGLSSFQSKYQHAQHARTCGALGFVLYWNRDFDGKAYCQNPDPLTGTKGRYMKNSLRDVRASNVQECCQVCSADEACEMFNYQWKSSRCWLKGPCNFFNSANAKQRDVEFIASGFDPSSIAGHILASEYFVYASMSLPKGAAAQILWWENTRRAQVDTPKSNHTSSFGVKQGTARGLHEYDLRGTQAAVPPEPTFLDTLG